MIYDTKENNNEKYKPVIFWDFRLDREIKEPVDDDEIRCCIVSIDDRQQLIDHTINRSLMSVYYLDVLGARRFDSPDQAAWNLDKIDLIFLIGEADEPTLFYLRSISVSCRPSLCWTFALKNRSCQSSEDLKPLGRTEIVTPLIGNIQDAMNIITRLLQIAFQMNPLIGYDVSDFKNAFGGRVTQAISMQSSIATYKKRFKEFTRLQQSRLAGARSVHLAMFYKNENMFSLKDVHELTLKEDQLREDVFANAFTVNLDLDQIPDFQAVIFTAAAEQFDQQYPGNREALNKHCEAKILGKLRLRELPTVTVNIRQLEGPNNQGRYTLQPHGDILEPSEWLNEHGAFNRLIHQFRQTYHQLLRDTDKETAYRSFLIEALVGIGNVSVSGGYNWVVMGRLKNGEHYCAILDVFVRQMFRFCGLMSLLKQTERDLAKQENCDFIQTWHSSYNPDFNAAIIPSLKTGFVLYRGDSNDGEDYEDKGCVHLRYYFDRKKLRNVRVWFKNGVEFQSPENNYLIIHHLLNSGPYPGIKIVRIEEYEQSSKES